MVNEDKSHCNGCNKLQHSTLYREFLAEREEILRHKWIESEKAGYDVGFEYALTDWIIKHRAKWRKWRKEQMAKQAKEGKEGNNPDKT